MRSSRWIVVLAAGGLLALPASSQAQFWPRVNPDVGGVWGGYGYAGANVTTRGIAAQNQQLGQVAAMGQNYVVQSGIRNTLSSQAQERTNSILSQRQSDRDWWFQTQQQQTAQRQAREAGSLAAVAGGFGGSPGGGFAPADSPPPVSTDVIKWPKVLQEQTFASRRALVEAPYRRSPPGLSTPTAGDYRDMVKTVGEMKAILEWRLGQRDGVPTEDYDQAKAFLNQIEREARQRSGDAA